MKVLPRLILLTSLFFSITRTHTQAQIIRTVVGTHDSLGNKGDDTAAIVAQVGEPVGVALDKSGDLYIADYYNNVVRKVTPKGIITTVAGTGSGGYNGDSILATTAQLNQPGGLAVDYLGNLYIADNANFRVRKVDTNGYITTVAGRGGVTGFGYSGDGGAATSAHLFALDIAVDQYQNIFIADGNATIRKVTHATGIITTVAGNDLYGYTGDNGPATSATLDNPSGVAVDPAGNIYIADYTNNVVRMVNTAATPVITTIAGTGTAGFSGDGGAATSARLNEPYSVSVDDSGNLYIIDQGNDRIRKVTNPTTSSAIITTVAGNGTTGYIGDGGLATSAHLNGPSRACEDSWGSIFIADANNTVVREVSNQAIVTINAIPGSNLCTGDTATFYAVVANPVLGELYQWEYNDTNVSTDTAFYANASIATGDQVSCSVAFPNYTSILAQSDTETMTVYPIIIPLVSISSDTNNICAGIPVVFSATAVNGGDAPLYQWLINGDVAYTSTSNTYTYDPGNNDVVSCILTSDAICARPDTAGSGFIRMDINADVIMNISIIAVGTDTFSKGQLTTFIAEPTNEGSSPAFQWLVNGVPVVGATSNVYNTDTLTDQDRVSCVLTGSQLCTLPLMDTSAPITISIPNGISQIAKAGNDMILLPNPNHGTFTIRGSSNSDYITIEVTDMPGSVVYSNKVIPQNGTINTQVTLDPALPSGIYMLRVFSLNQRSTTPFILSK